MKQIIEKENAGLNVKQYIAKRIPGLSRRILIDLKNRQDGIMVNGSRVTVRCVLHENDTLSLAIDDEVSGNVTPSAILPDILYEDEDLVAVNKPAGILTHPSIDRPTDNLASSLAYYYHLQDRPFVCRVLNRLDGVASGVVIVAKNHLASARLSAVLQKKQIRKHYFALVEGVVKRGIGVIDASIKRSPTSILERTTCQRGDGEYALTTYRVLERYDNRTLLDAFPHTGRTHQLRVHLSSIGHPIVGDFLYGTTDAALGDRVALHCASMTFPHPMSGDVMTVTAPLPNEILNLLPTKNKEIPR